MTPVVSLPRVRLIGIGELTVLSGFTARALRHYEAEGVIQARRDRYNVRCYDDRMRQRVLLLARLRQAGLSLKEARPILDAAGDRAVAELTQSKVAARLRRLDAEREALQRLADSLEVGAANARQDSAPHSG